MTEFDYLLAGLIKTITRRKSMRRMILLVVMLMLSLSVSNSLFAAEVKTEENRVYGMVVKADCDKSSVTIEEISKDKTKKTEMTVKLTDKTQLLGFNACNEIAVGSKVFGRYVKTGEDNVLTRLSGQPAGRTAKAATVSPAGRTPNAVTGEETKTKK